MNTFLKSIFLLSVLILWSCNDHTLMAELEQSYETGTKERRRKNKGLPKRVKALEKKVADLCSKVDSLSKLGQPSTNVELDKEVKANWKYQGKQVWMYATKLRTNNFGHAGKNVAFLRVATPISVRAFTSNPTTNITETSMIDRRGINTKFIFTSGHYTANSLRIASVRLNGSAYRMYNDFWVIFEYTKNEPN